MLNAIRNAILGRPQDKPIKAAGLKRSPQWPTVRKKHLEKNPMCAVCGVTKDVQVHHKKPFHLNPALELDQTNLISLCDENSHDCHIIFGHLSDWSSFNADVQEDADRMREKIKTRPKT